MDSEGDGRAAAASVGVQTTTSRRWFNVRTFTVLASVGLQGYILVFSFQMATITTIQKLYGLSTFKVGLLFFIYEVGEITAGVLGSYFASRSRKPRVVAAGMLLTALSCLLFTAPHFVFSAPDGGGGDYDDTSVLDIRRMEASCVLGESAAVVAVAAVPRPHLAAYSTVNATGDAATPAMQCSDEGGRVANAVMIMYSLANVVLGVGFSPMWSMTVVYIDDNADSKTAATFYQSTLYMVSYFGYMVGYGVAAGALSIHTSLQSVAMTPSHDRWVGAWWLGFVLCAILETVVAITLFFFPARIRNPEKSCLADLKPEGHCSDDPVNHAEKAFEVKPNAVTDPNDDDDDCCLDDYKDELPSAKELLPTLWEFIKNPLFILTVLSRSTVYFVDAGFFVYLPKYLETQFHQSAALADMQTGLAGSLVSTVTVLIGGWIISKYKLAIKQCAAMILTTYFLGSMLFVAATFLSCPQNIADPGLLHDSRYNCSTADYYPVCVNYTTYYSPCHAGCQNASAGTDGSLVFTGCLCSAFDNETTSGTEGVCHAECKSQLLWYLVVVMFAYSMPSFSAMATITVLLRCVKRDHRSFGLGIYQGAISLFAWIPSPMIYGAFVDMTCLTWGSGSQDCVGNEEQGACNQYDNSEFRIGVHTLTIGSLAAGSLLGACTWVVANYREKRSAAHHQRQRVIASTSVQTSRNVLITMSLLNVAQA